MRICFILYCCFLFGCSVSDSESTATKQSPEMMEDQYFYLALGDSYTIGQSVSPTENFPTQLKDSLNNHLSKATSNEIIATTGWRTDQLLNASEHTNRTSYDMVSLLIGVNNQYQQKPFSQYTTEFPLLLNKAIALAQNNPKNVVVLSIPDYAYTPYGEQLNSANISEEIDEYNAFAKATVEAKGVTFIDITPITRQGLTQPNLVAIDGLHPSGKAYSLFVSAMLPSVLDILE